MPHFDGQVVLVTGASAGLGAALAREFSRQGATVVLLARRAERIAALADELGGGRGRALAIPADVTRDGDLERAVAETLSRLGRIDVVVANAGFAVAGRFARLSLDDYRRQFETNVFGVLRTAGAALAPLQASRGTLVLIGSVAGHVSLPSGSAYSMSKFAVRALAEALDGELRRDGIATVLVSPGFVRTEMHLVDNQGRPRAEGRDSIPPWLRITAGAAARQIVRGVRWRRPEVVVTGHGKLLVLLSRLAPWLMRSLVRRMARAGKSRPPG
jgi:NAD(P)-dependent dehydrogenase (short-subunit alcohol dehydrogenase family)